MRKRVTVRAVPPSDNSHMATFPAPRLLRATEYAELDEVPGFRDELIEGEHVVSPSPKLAHGRVIERLERILGQQLAEIAHAAGIRDTQLRIEREQGWLFQTANQIDSILEPDLMVIRELDAQRALETDNWFQGVPVLVVEVVSPSERRSRRLQKLGLYLEMGVQHIIEVDYKRQIVLVYTPETDSPTRYGVHDQIAIPFQAKIRDLVSILDESSS